MEYVVKCNWDPEAEVWWSECESLPVTMESDTLDQLLKKVTQVAPEIAELNGMPKPSCLYFLTEPRKEVCA